jgi:hypothetical protein
MTPKSRNIRFLTYFITIGGLALMVLGGASTERGPSFPDEIYYCLAFLGVDTFINTFAIIKGQSKAICVFNFVYIVILLSLSIHGYWFEKYRYLKSLYDHQKEQRKERVENNSTLSLLHEVHVPSEFAAGRGAFATKSDHERYVESYEMGWWACIEERVKDYNSKETEDDIKINGWGGTISGFYSGYRDCRLRIKLLIENIGAEKTKELIKDAWDGA